MAKQRGHRELHAIRKIKRLLYRYLLVWPVSDSAFDPAWRFEFVTPGFESAPPTEIIGQILGGDAVEAVEPLLKTAVIGIDVVDVQVRRRRCRLSRRWHGVEGNPGPAGESGDRLPTFADERIARRDDSGEGEAHRSAIDLRQTTLAFSSAAIASPRWPSLIPEIANSQAAKSSGFIESLPRSEPP